MEEDIKSLDKRLFRIQKSTRTFFGPFLPLHNLLRSKFSWYYRWHVFAFCVPLHWFLLFCFLSYSSYLVYAKTVSPVLVPSVIQEPDWPAPTLVSTASPESLQLPTPSAVLSSSPAPASYYATPYPTPTPTISATSTISPPSPVPLLSFKVEGFPGEIQAGQIFPNQITISALDKNSQIKTDFQKSIYFSTTDAKASTPLHYSFTLNDQGRAILSGADFVFKTAGSQTLTVSENESSVSTGVSLFVLPASLNQLVISPSFALLNFYQNQQFEAYGFDQYQNKIIDFPKTWELREPDIGSVDGKGKFKAKSKAGKFNNAIRVYSSEISASASLEIKPTTVSVLSPNGGEVWYQGEEREISWQMEGETISKVTLYYSINEIQYKVIETLPATLKYLWTIPNNINSDRVTIRIELYDKDDNLLSWDISDSPFTIDKKKQKQAFGISMRIAALKNLLQGYGYIYR